MSVIKTTLTAILIICAVIMTALVVRRELFLNNTPDSKPEKILPDSLWQIVSAYKPTYESKSAQVRLVEFFDYECPYCKRFNQVLDSILTKYPKDVSLIYRHFPLDYHPRAYHAAIAAECAGEQGDFKTYHDMLFENQAQLANNAMSWIALAQDAGVSDIERFRTCVIDERTRHRVNVDTALVHMVGVEEIPALVVNGAMYTGTMSVSELDIIIQKALKDAE